MVHTSEGARDAWRIPQPHSCGNDTGAGADAQPHEARVGPFRAPATKKLSDQRSHFNCGSNAGRRLRPQRQLLPQPPLHALFPFGCPAWRGSPHEDFVLRRVGLCTAATAAPPLPST